MALQAIGHEMHRLSDLESMTRHDDPFPASTGRLDPLAIRAGYVGVRGENASKNPVVVET